MVRPLEEQNQKVDLKEYLLTAIFIAGLLISYLLFSYGEYVECVNDVEFYASFEYDENDTSLILKNPKPSEILKNCKFPYFPNN